MCPRTQLTAPTYPGTVRKFCLKAACRFEARAHHRVRAQLNNDCIDQYITLANDEQTATVKGDATIRQKIAKDHVHQLTNTNNKPTLWKHNCNAEADARAKAKRML